MTIESQLRAALEELGAPADLLRRAYLGDPPTRPPVGSATVVFSFAAWPHIARAIDRASSTLERAARAGIVDELDSFGPVESVATLHVAERIIESQQHEAQATAALLAQAVSLCCWALVAHLKEVRAEPEAQRAHARLVDALNTPQLKIVA